MAAKPVDLALGIDFGTTSVKVVAVEKTKEERNSEFKVVATVEKNTEGNVLFDPLIPDHHPNGDLQDPDKIYHTLVNCLTELPEDVGARVTNIGLTGQMHGVVYWSSNSSRTPSHLITWQDQRCDAEFLATLPKSSTTSALSSGFGLATTIWLARQQKGFLDGYDRAGSILDYITCRLTGDWSSAVNMGPQMAMSWGYFDPVTGKFDVEAITSAKDIRPSMIPNVVAEGTNIGVLSQDIGPLKSDGSVHLHSGLGDCQAYIMSMLRDGNYQSACLNVSTSAQVAAVAPPNFLSKTKLPPTVHLWPFESSSGRMIAMAASLNGGNVLDSFAKTVKSWCEDITGKTVNEANVWSAITRYCGTEPGVQGIEKAIVRPFGERHDPRRLVNLDGCPASGFVPFQCMVKTICDGIVSNLATMMPVQFLKDLGIDRILVSGGCAARSPAIVEAIRKCFSGLEVEVVDEKATGASSAMGAAIFAARM